MCCTKNALWLTDWLTDFSIPVTLTQTSKKGLVLKQKLIEDVSLIDFCCWFLSLSSVSNVTSVSHNVWKWESPALYFLSLLSLTYCLRRQTQLSLQRVNHCRSLAQYDYLYYWLLQLFWHLPGLIQCQSELLIVSWSKWVSHVSNDVFCINSPI